MAILLESHKILKSILILRNMQMVVLLSLVEQQITIRIL